MNLELLVHVDKTFSKINYTGKEVKNREFERCTFVGCDLSGSNFSQSRFIDCQFIGCNLSLIKLKGARLSNALFKECKLTGINFSECEDIFFTVKLEQSILDYASFADRKMPKTHFINSSLKGVIFTGANLEKALFENTDMAGAVFNNTNLKEANLVTAYNYSIDPELNNLKKASFSLHGISGLLDKYGINII